MILSEISVRRPVFATVLSLILVIVGLMALGNLPIREYPDIERPVVNVDGNYRGASAEIVERKITQLVEDAVAGIEGIEKLTSTSYDGRFDVTIEFSAERDLDAAANDVRERVARVVEDLPEEAEPPEITKARGGTGATMYIDLSSTSRSPMELTDFAERYLVDQFSIVNGVANVRVFGGRQLAMRVWIEPEALAARGLTVTDIEDALRRENIELPAGRIESTEREFTLRTATGLSSVDDFRRLVVGRGRDGYLIRLEEVADVELAPEDDRSISRSNGIAGVSMGIIPQSKANILMLNTGVREQIERIQPTLPDDINLSVNLDFSVFISESIKEVVKALGLALALVLIVIYGFIGSIRATLIPALTIPVSIIAAFTVMAAMGYSINVLTLLGLVLAIGLVVDDAIVVLENIARRIEEGEPGLLAAVNGSREIGFAVIATTAVLVSVFIPISFMEGTVGRLFGEFGISLAAAVVFSSLVALTLVPMLSSKLLGRRIRRGRFSRSVDALFRRLSRRYEAGLRRFLRRPVLVLLGSAILFAASLVLMARLPVEYAPPEDQGAAFIAMTGPDGASLAYMDRYARQVEEIVLPDVEQGDVRRILTRSAWGGGADVNRMFFYVPLALWSERDRTAEQIVSGWRPELATLPGVNVFARGSSSGLGIRGSNRPVELVLGGTDYTEIADWAERVIDRASEENPRLLGLETDYQERKPKMDVGIDRNRAADLGVSLATIGRTLETVLGSRRVTTFIDGGEEYNVILQGGMETRSTPDDLASIFVRSDVTGRLIPLSNMVNLVETSGPVDLKRFDRLRAITISGGLAPGYSLGEALTYLENVVAEELPSEVQVNYDGESREFKRSGSALYTTFLLSLLIAFLVLAAQFESFRHPLVIMVTVPLAIAGALVGIWIFGSSINVFSQIGAIMLIGLAAKNGVLIVEFANQLRDRGVEFREAVIQAAGIRLRPVLMTSMCTAFGAVPLMLAAGAGAEARQSIGSVVFFGVTFSVFLTLLVVPAVYTLVARNTRSPEYVGKLIDRLRRREQAAAAEEQLTR
ncbi:MAG: efflux RND transporter permease subunit [Gammaproteobacteria bacterium]